ncbi:hypothetical protein PoMZ_13224 [Pyricularia oryzae]|nr:hypothetical protein PoMZ_13224 [Pyricularia oryzae]
MTPPQTGAWAAAGTAAAGASAASIRSARRPLSSSLRALAAVQQQNDITTGARSSVFTKTKTKTSVKPIESKNIVQIAKMSTMEATAGHSKACCNVPPVVESGYEKKGTYEEVGGYKTYVTGPQDATKGIIAIYDIFGYFDQTLQGMDILATSDASQKYRVFMPDWFKGNPCPIEWYPPNTEEKQQKVGNWFKDWNPAETAAKVPDYVKAVQEKNPGIKSWGIIGFCWGGKIVCLTTSSDNNPFAAGASIHPAMVDAADAKNIKVPLIMLASKDEAAKDVSAFEESLPSSVPKHIETFGDQVHGWMAARADLKDARVKEEYTRGYKTVIEFFGKNWN